MRQQVNEPGKYMASRERLAGANSWVCVSWTRCGQHERAGLMCHTHVQLRRVRLTCRRVRSVTALGEQP